MSIPLPPGIPAPPIKELDHWEILIDMSKGLGELSSNVRTIHDCLDLEKVGESRQDLAIITVDTYLYCAKLRAKLSIMDGEWTTLMKEREI